MNKKTTLFLITLILVVVLVIKNNSINVINNSHVGLSPKTVEIPILDSNVANNQNNSQKSLPEIGYEPSSECKNAQAQIHNLYAQKQSLEDEFFELLKNNYAADAEFIVNHSNFSPYHYRAHLSDMPEDYQSLPPSDDPIPPPEIAKIIKLNQIILTKNYDEIKKLVMEGKVDRSTTFNGTSILISMIITNPQLTLKDIAEVISVGMKINLSDLVYVTIMGIDINILEMFHMNYDGDIHQVWDNGFRKDNLLLTAVSTKNISAFNYWRAQGVSPTISEDEYNAMDLLPSPTNEKDSYVIDEIFLELAKYNIYPHEYQNFIKLKDKISPDLYQDSSSYFENSPTRKKVKLVGRYADLDNLMKELNVSFQKVLSKYSACDLQNFLSKEQNIWDKNNVVNDFRLISSIYKDLEPTQLEYLDESLSIQGSLLEEKWDTYFNKMERLDDEFGSSDFESLGLIQLILNKAPSRSIVDEVKSGKQLNDITIFAIIQADRLELIKELTPYGLVINSTDPEGLSSLEFAKKLGREHFIPTLREYQ